MLPEANCPRCGIALERGVLRTQWMTVHPEQMLAALRDMEEAEWQGKSAKAFAGTATTIAYRNLRGEKMLRCLYCPACAVVIAARDDLIVDAPSFSRFARRASGGHTVFASRLRAWRLVRGVVAGAIFGLAAGAVLFSQRSWLSVREYVMVPVVLFAGLGLCWGMWLDMRSSFRRVRALRLQAELEDRGRRNGLRPSSTRPFDEQRTFDFAQGVS